MKPGATAKPSASMVFAAFPFNLPTSAFFPSLPPTSATKEGRPEPSTTRPRRTKRSYSILHPPRSASQRSFALAIFHTIRKGKRAVNQNGHDKRRRDGKDRCLR